MKRSMIYVSLENRCRVKHDTSRKLASLRINVHSVKKINWINTINSPQRCRISLVFSPRHLKSYSLCFQKINICLCTVLRESRGFEMGGCCFFFCVCVKYLQSWWLRFFWDDQQKWFKWSDIKGLIWIQTVWFCEDEMGTTCRASEGYVFPRIKYSRWANIKQDHKSLLANKQHSKLLSPRM